MSPDPGAKPDWSVVVVNFDGGELLARCVESVLENARGLVEVVVVDNASSDGSAEAAAADRRVRVLRNATNAGFPRACNQGIDASTGELLVILNPDAVVPSGFFDAARAGIGGDGPFDLVTFAQDDEHDLNASTGPFLTPAEVARQVLLRRRGRARLAAAVAVGSHRFVPVTQGYVSGYCMVARRATLEGVGAFDPALFWAEDADLSLRLARTGARLGVCVSTTLHHERSYNRRNQVGLVTFFQLTSKVAYTRRHHRRSFPLVWLTVMCVSAVRFAWFRTGGRARPASREKTTAYRAVIRHLVTRGWMQPQGWDRGLVDGLRR